MLGLSQGISTGRALRKDADDRAWDAEEHARQRQNWQAHDEARARQKIEWAQGDEDRARRLKLEGDNSAWVDEQRNRQRGEWGRQDDLRTAERAAFEDAKANRAQAVEKSITPKSVFGPTMTGDGALPDKYAVGAKVYDNRDDARRAAEARADSLFSFINGQHADEITQKAIEAGNMEPAKAYKPWLANQKVQAGVRHFADAVGKFGVGDVEGAITSLNDAYNSKGYLDDGRQARIVGVKRDEGGKPISADVEFTNETSGQKHVEHGVDVNQIFHQAVAMLAPDQVVDYGLKQIQAERNAAAAQANDRRALELDIAKKRAEMELKRQEAGSGNPYAAGGSFNEGQGKAASFADRMAEAEDILRQTEGVNSGVSGGAGGLVTDMLPAAASNIVSGKDRQRHVQARRDFVNAILRRESGAAISQSEFDNAAMQYFVQPGDDEATIAQKRANRATAIKGLMREAGPSYKPPAAWADPNASQAPAQATKPQAASKARAVIPPTAAAHAAAISQARAAIAKGGNPAVIAERLRNWGVDPEGLRQ